MSEVNRNRSHGPFLSGTWRSLRGRALMTCAAILGCALAAPAKTQGLTTIDAHASYPECPVWRDGKLYYCEYGASNIKVWDGHRASVYWHKNGCGANGLIEFHGHFLVACYDDNTLVELDSRGQEVQVIRADTSGKPMAGPNDFSPDGHGGIYFSTSGVYDLKAPIAGKVLHLAADGKTLIEVADLIHYSNGLTLAKDGKHLLVAEMLAGRILSFPIEADGALGARTVWARLQDLAAPTPHADAYNGPDGLKLGPDGNYYIAQNGSGRVIVVDDDRKLVRTIVVPAPYVTNMAFGANGANTVFITGSFEQWKAPYPGAVYRWTH